MCVNQRAPPYAADTRAKGWRFELDYERIDESDTWAMAAELPLAQHALLMMWLVAWSQEPCGTLPNDEQVIRAHCRIPAAMWAKQRQVLMRGWWQADDGRLYHPTITKRVLAMLDKRTKDVKRTAGRRGRIAESLVIPPGVTEVSRVTHTGLTEVSRVTPPGVTREFDTKHQAPEEEKKDLFPISGETGGERSATSKPKRSSEKSPGFERFWKAYPRKVGKDAAIREFERRKPTPELVETMVEAVAEQRASEQWTRDRGKFIPHPSTWLHDGRWQDEPAEVNGADVFEGSR